MDVGMNCVNLVITGNPGVGKHTIADLFIKQDSSYQIFDINKFAIEKEFGISFALGEIMELKDVGAMIELIEKKIKIKYE